MHTTRMHMHVCQLQTEQQGTDRRPEPVQDLSSTSTSLHVVHHRRASRPNCTLQPPIRGGSSGRFSCQKVQGEERPGTRALTDSQHCGDRAREASPAWRFVGLVAVSEHTHLQSSPSSLLYASMLCKLAACSSLPHFARFTQPKIDSPEGQMRMIDNRPRAARSRCRNGESPSVRGVTGIPEPPLRCSRVI
ncbi:hypothetical protein L226DRAFT_136305 [Lentinus tigrinus ALCF2SS1-7]|uniref:Uncharacterized protein n=1 Tax=Lentinus tigrinus ALCF2SS1-6 TaxID=1328759 RepID=A0A5C2SW38_9APHY|nr:hypothetical protein L227DRAFT_24234 [Lentinus tigrinus ALCF2SS1-6]RPD81370.1 hypothetical protein L226DRAFT_136305 [Lentinus tigrinus ALCF2SS1-7]